MALAVPEASPELGHHYIQADNDQPQGHPLQENRIEEANNYNCQRIDSILTRTQQTSKNGKTDKSQYCRKRLEQKINQTMFSQHTFLNHKKRKQ
ncbi:hypothetical protein P4055_27240 [Pseudomonas aeruginosa]|nr:hypothetical protein [Pseudomonas aeruginosa]